MTRGVIQTHLTDGGIAMKTTTNLLLVLCLGLSLAACKKEEAKPAAAPKAAMSAPTANDSKSWGAYLQDVVPRNMQGISNQPFVYLLAGDGASAEFKGNYERLMDKATTDIQRGVLPGNLLVYASPASDRMADFVTEVYRAAQPNSMKGSRVLFIGKPADSERVRAAVAASGVEYVFVEAK